MFIKSRNSRPGFTLVEIIVVITIMAVLFGMVASAVTNAMKTALDAKVSTEITQMAGAVEAFKSKYGVSYLPSEFRLRNTIAGYDAAIAAAGTNQPLIQFERDCKNFLLRMFPRINTAAVIGWTGDPTNPNSAIDLNGSECLVFFLGGRCVKVGTSVTALGWGSNPVNPWPNPLAGDKGIASFEFDAARLMSSPYNSANTGICVYLDGFASGQNDMPYFYFSSYKSGNDYGAYGAVKPSLISSSTIAAANAPPMWTGVSAFNIAPFMNSQNLNAQQNKFHNANTFQLISAGRNKRVGNFTKLSVSPDRVNFVIWENGVFDVNTIPPAEWTMPTLPPDRENETVDNLCNFHGGKMGVPQ